MDEPSKSVRPPKNNKEKKESYTAELVHLLEGMDFKGAQQAAELLGEKADAAAIQVLVWVLRQSAALRCTAMAALKKIGNQNDAAATQLAIVLLRETQVDLRGAPLADRRRAPRVLLEIPVVVRWKDEKGESHSEASTTKVVNAYGALLHLKSPMVVDRELEVNNVTTLAKIKACVVWVGDPLPEGGQEIGIELGDPDPEFWVGKSSAEEDSFLPRSP